MNSRDLSEKMISLQRDLASLDAEREQQAAFAEAGVSTGTRTMAGLNQQRAKLVEAIEQVRLAHGVALRKENAEVRAEAERRELERMHRERRIGEEANATVASIQERLEGVVADLKKLSDLHEAYGLSLPDYIVAAGAALPSLIDNALGQSGVFGLAGRCAQFNTTRGGVRLDQSLTSAYPKPHHFVQSKPRAA